MRTYADSLASPGLNAADERPFKLGIENQTRQGLLSTYMPPTPMDCNEDQFWLWHNGSIFNMYRPKHAPPNGFKLRECLYMHFGGGGTLGERKKVFFRMLGEYFGRGYHHDASVGMAYFHYEIVFFRFVADRRWSLFEGGILAGGWAPPELGAVVDYDRHLKPILAALLKEPYAQ